MKKLFFALLALPLLVACNQDIKDENARLKLENERLSSNVSSQDSVINSFIDDFARIQENLAAIREREESIQAASEGDMEKSDNVRESVINDVEVINQLLSENRLLINDLNGKLAKSKGDNSRLRKMTANLQKEIETKDSQILELKENLASMNFEMNQLNSKLDTANALTKKQQQEIQEKTANLNTAYYAVGTASELEENNVIDRKGGVIGIGRTKTMADDFDLAYFTQIDITKTTNIPLDVAEKKMKIVSSHPSDSFTLNKSEEGRITGLEITNPTKFWKTSKHLVIIAD